MAEDQAAAGSGSRDGLLERTIFYLTAEQSERLLDALNDPGLKTRDHARIRQLLSAPLPWHGNP